MNGLSLFTGSGIGDLVFREIIPGYRTVCYVENEPFCVAHLIKNITDGLIDDAPIWDDIRTFDTSPYRGMVDIVFGGFPCQPFSTLGKNKGAEDERNMWPDTARVIREVRPRYAFLENVPGLLVHKYIRRIFGDLAEIGYDCEWDVVSARACGAPFADASQIYIMAQATSRGRGPDFSQPKVFPKTCEGGSISERCRWHDGGADKIGVAWQTEPDVGRVADGVANRVHRLRMLGNGWVPQVVARILEVSNDPA